MKAGLEVQTLTDECELKEQVCGPKNQLRTNGSTQAVRDAALVSDKLASEVRQH